MADHAEIKALRPNVGFMLKEPAGYRRSIPIEIGATQLAADAPLIFLAGELELTRNSQGIWVDGTLQCAAPVSCARCLEDFDQSIELQLQEMFYYPPSKAPSATEYIIREDGILDLVEPIREQMVLSVPIRPICQPTCRGLCPHCGRNLNEGECECQDEEVDPRLEALKSLKERLSREDDVA